MKIGMIVAIPEEIDALFRTCGEPAGTEEAPGYTIYKYNIGSHTVFVAGSGAGEISAASTTQYLITKYGAEFIVNFGVVGGLTPDMSLCSTVIVEKAVHYDFDASPFDKSIPGQYKGLFPDVYIPASPEILSIAAKAVPEIRQVICASADKFVDDAEAKAALHKRYGAEICEMEAAGIMLTAHRNKVPMLLVKGVSDSVTGGAMEFGEMVHRSAEVCLKVLLSVLEAL